jgi:hypothetical protein
MQALRRAESRLRVAGQEEVEVPAVRGEAGLCVALEEQAAEEEARPT